MFGFGKKKLDDRLMGGVIVEIGMFQSWTLDKRGVDLNPEQLEKIVVGILNRENVKYSKDQVFAIKSMVILNMEFEQLRTLRKNTNFDAQVAGFCRSINLPPEFYTPKR